MEQIRSGASQDLHAATSLSTAVANFSFDSMTVIKCGGMSQPFNLDKVRRFVISCMAGLEADVSVDLVLTEFLRNVYDGITTEEIYEALVLAAVAFIERDEAYDKLAARMLRRKAYKEVMGQELDEQSLTQLYQKAFTQGISKGMQEGVFDPRLAEFDLQVLAGALKPERDELFYYLGMQTLYNKYFVKSNKRRVELPQTFFMRVAMGLSLLEEDKTGRAVEFYNLISSQAYMPGTPTLLHSGLMRPQLSSCFLSTVKDDLRHIFKCFGDNAQMSKWSGGVANDWTNIRATGAAVSTIKVDSQGLIPFLKIANDVTASINRSGSRRGATVVYLETWHLDIEDFVDLRRNTGDERRRTHDINTANWIPDLFMKRVEANGDWTLFSPDEVPDLHDLYGKAFEARYEQYEQMASEGKIRLHKTLKAADLWKKMLSRLFETGHPWMVYKDACNVRSPQDHVGVVHSSNLCTEITLNTSEDETAVCNLGSVNLAHHIKDGKLDETKLEATINTAMRMLDNVIDINFYPTIEGQNSNMRHRPVGMGMMGVQDALAQIGIGFDDERALTFADEMGESFSYFAIKASCALARERGPYSTYQGSKWDRGIFPIDTLDLLEQERGVKIDIPRSCKKDWSSLRAQVKEHGIRNSNMMAVAPTATIANITGCFPCIEPIYKNVYVKANMSGEFTVVNRYLMRELKELGLWDSQMLDLIKYYDGSIQAIEAIPLSVRRKYKEAFELDPAWLLKITAVRGKWIDQSQSHNVFMKGVSGKLLSDIYTTAWRLGMKATYYLRTLGATQIEKSTLDAKKFGYTQKRQYEPVAQAAAEVPVVAATAVDGKKSCSITDSECDSCQ